MEVVNRHRVYEKPVTILLSDAPTKDNDARECRDGMFALRAHGTVRLDYVCPEEPPSTALGNALTTR